MPFSLVLRVQNMSKSFSEPCMISQSTQRMKTECYPGSKPLLLGGVSYFPVLAESEHETGKGELRQ
jgi:hypothetical protein